MNRRSFFQSLGLVATTAGLTYWLSRPKRVPPKGIYVQMGTSITAGLHAPGAHLTPIVVGSRLNLTPINVGFDGACAAARNAAIMDKFSLCGLVDAVTSKDWSAQDEAVAALEPFNTPILSRFKAIDFRKVTYLALEYGPNDFTMGVPIGTMSDATKETFHGALNYSIRKLLASFPNLHLVLIAPAWRLNSEDRDSDIHPNSGGIFLREYADAMVAAAATHHIPCLDMSRTLGLNISNYKSFTFDGTHPNQVGAIIRGEVIAAFMASVFSEKLRI